MAVFQWTKDPFSVLDPQFDDDRRLPFARLEDGMTLPPVTAAPPTPAPAPTPPFDEDDGDESDVESSSDGGEKTMNSPAGGIVNGPAGNAPGTKVAASEGESDGLSIVLLIVGALVGLLVVVIVAAFVRARIVERKDAKNRRASVALTREEAQQLDRQIRLEEAVNRSDKAALSQSMSRTSAGESATDLSGHSVSEAPPVTVGHYGEAPRFQDEIQ